MQPSINKYHHALMYLPNGDDSSTGSRLRSFPPLLCRAALRLPVWISAGHGARVPRLQTVGTVVLPTVARTKAIPNQEIEKKTNHAKNSQLKLGHQIYDLLRPHRVPQEPMRPKDGRAAEASIGHKSQIVSERRDEGALRQAAKGHRFQGAATGAVNRGEQ